MIAWELERHWLKHTGESLIGFAAQRITDAGGISLCLREIDAYNYQQNYSPQMENRAWYGAL